MAKEVSVGVKVKLQADAKEMQRIIDDLETRLSNIKTDSSLGKSLSRQLQKMKDQAGDFRLLGEQQIVNSSDLSAAVTLAKNFYKQVGRFSEDYEKGSFKAFSFDEEQLKDLKRAKKALEDFDKSKKDRLNKKTTGEIFGKHTEEAKEIQKAFKAINKDVNKDSSFLDTKKDIEQSKKKAQEEASATERNLAKEVQLKQAAAVAKQTAENNIKVKQQELAKVQKLEQNYQKRKEVSDELTKKESFKDAQEFRDYFNSAIFQSDKTKFKGGGKEKASQLLALMGFNPEEIPEDAKLLKEKVAKEISNASDDEVKKLSENMLNNAKEFSAKGYKNAQSKTKTTIKKTQEGIEAEQNNLNNATKTFETKEKNIKELESTLSIQKVLVQQLDSLEKDVDALWKKVVDQEDSDNKSEREKLVNKITDEEKKAMSSFKEYTGSLKDAASGIYQNEHALKEEEKARQQAEQEAANFKANLQASIKHWMGAQQVITLVRQGIRQAYQDIQGLDKAMTNIAVVTDFNVSDLWGKINDYMQVAQQYGVTTQGVYEVSQLYFQQGLGEADTMAATTETLKMARIAGMDYAEAADGMTVAIRGFNMEMQDAARVTDVYSKVAAITASDTQELVTAMSKTASSAAAVGSSFENTTAMLAVMIEATRESPQNLGSALKSIISRYGEMTKGLSEDSEGEEIDYNRVDAALKTVGISIKDAQGQFRDFDAVIEELSAKWNTLDSVTQRYIATIFAGNRQQSRFLALVSNYERYMEVSEAAANSEDAGLLQYSKTLDSLETKINNIKTSFQQFYMSLINGDNIKGALDFINSLIKGLNKLNKLSSVFSLTGIITSVKLVGSSLVNSLTPYITQISNKFKQGYAEIANSSRTGGMTAGKAFRDAYENAIATGSTETQAIRAGGWAGIKAFGKNHASSIANIAALAGSGLSLLGISTASNNAVLGSGLSMAGSALSGAAIGASFGPWGALIGGITGAVSQLPSLINSLDKNVWAQEQLTKLRETTEEKNIERAQAKSDYENLSSLLKQYKDLEETRYDNDETYEKWLDVNNQLTEAYPALLGYIDEHGNAIADITNASTLLSNAMQNAANATADYYYAKVAEIEQELRISRETVYSPHYTRGYGKREAGYKEFSQAKQSALQYSTINARSHLQQMTSEQIMNWVKGEGIDLQKALADIQGHGKGYSGIADYLWFIGAIEESTEGVFSWAEDFNKYIKATEQLQTLDVTKKTGALAGISNASKLSTFDDAIEGISGYTALIETYATSFKDMSWEDLVKISEEDYDKLIREFVLFYDGLSTSQQEILSDLYDNLQNLSLSDLQIQFKDFGLEDTKLYQTYYKEWINQNYQTRYKLAESIFGKDAFITKKDLYSPEELLALASGKQVRSLKDEKFGTYAEWLEQGDYEDNAKNREIYYQRSIAFIKDINEGLGNFIENSTLSQLQLYANFLNKEASVQEGGGIAAEVSADRQKTITDLISRVFDKEDSFFSLLKPETLTEFFDLLFTEPGTNEWAKNLQQFETEYGDLGIDFSQLVFENFLTQTNIVLDKIDSFTEKIDDLATKQEKGFTLAESFDLLKELQKIDSSATWDNIFKYNEEGILVLKDFSSVLDSLYEDQFNIEDLRSKYQTGLEFIESLTQNKDVLASEALGLWSEADLEDYTMALSAGTDLSPEVIDSMATYLSQNADATIESFTEWYYQTFGVPLENAQQYFDNYKENKLQEDTIRKRTEQLEGTLEERNKQAAYQMLSSKGLEGYTEKEIAQLETYLGSGLGAIETGEGTGEYRIDQSKLAELPQWVQTAIWNIINDSTQSSLDEIAGLGAEASKIGGADKGVYVSAFEKYAKRFGAEWTENYIPSLIEGATAESYSDAAKYGSFTSRLKNLIKQENPEATDEEIEEKTRELINGYKDGLKEAEEEIINLKLDALEKGFISASDKETLKEVDIDFAQSFDEAIAKTGIERAQAIYNLIEETLSQKVNSGSMTELEKIEELGKTSSEQFQVLYQEKLKNAYFEEAKTSIIEGDRILSFDELGKLQVASGKSLKDFYSKYIKGITETGEAILNIPAMFADGIITDKQYAQFQRNFAEETFGSAEDLITRMASKDDVYADEIENFFEALGAPLQEGEAELLLQSGVQTFLSKIESTLLAAGVPQSDVDSRLTEIQAQLVDLLLESISSGVSSLGEGIEGTLSNQDWNALIQKYASANLGQYRTRQTLSGVQLSDEAQIALATAQYSEALSKGITGWDFAEQLWEVAEGVDSAFGNIESIEEALANATGESKKLLQQLLNIAMLDEDDSLFNFMEQDATGERTKNFDNFVNQIDKVKSIFSSFQSGEAIGYQDFYNMMDFMDQQSSGALSDFSKEISNSMPGLQKLQSQLIASGKSYEKFVNSVVANTDEWGKVDIGDVAAEMGISVEAAMEGMAEGMADGLKEVARKQVQYLSGLEAMLEALAALESIGDISLGLGLEFTATTGETITIDTLNDIVKYWEVLKPIDQKTLIIELQTALKDGNSDVDTALQKVFGKGFSLYDLLGGENFFTSENFDIGTIEAITSLSDLTQGQAYSLAMKMNAEIKLEEGSDFTIDENGIRQYTESGYQKLQDYIKQNYKDFYKVEEYPFDFEVANKANVKLAKEGITIEGVDISGWSEMDDKMKTAVKEKVETAYAEEGLDIEVSPEGKLISTPILKEVEAVNTDFQTAADAASTLQTAITQISTAVSTFQASSGFQSLADQLNAAADAAERLASALGIKIETPQMPKMPFGTGEGQINGMDHLSSQDILGLGMGPLSPEGLNAQLNQMFATQFAGDAALQIPAKIVGEGGADVTDALKTNLLSKPAIPVPGKLDLSAGGKGTGKEADKVEIEAEVDTESANEQLDTLKTSMDTVSESSPIQTETTDNGTTQAVIELLNAAYEATVLVEETDPNTSVTETGSSFVKEQLDAVAQAANSIPTSINISVGVSGVAKALGSIALLKLAGGLWTGNMNDISGSALADGNVEDSARKLIVGANIANKTLVGELGPELMVYNNQYHLVGQNGAEFVDVPKDAIVFNHLQTKGIFNGQMGIRGKAMAAGNVTGPAAASGIAGALAAVRRAKSVWQGLLNSLSAADLMGGGGGGGGGGGDENSLKAHIADLQEWYNLSRQIADIEGQINILLAKRKSLTDGHEYLRNLRTTQKLLEDQVNTQEDLLRFQELQLQRQADHINNNKIWSQFLEVDENGLLQYKEGNETNGGKGALEVLQKMNEMSGSEQLAYVKSLGWSYTTTDDEELEDEELVAKFFEELQKQIDDYDALRDTVVEAEEALADLEEEIRSIDQEIRDNEIDLSQEIYDIIVKAWEENIANLKKQNDLIKEANEAYANGIQEAIDAERQMYDQNTAISDREQLQRQLALMRRSGSSASEIADLEQQLDDMLKEEYFSNQEKQLETIQKANERQVELMDQQVKLQEEALEYEKENGVIWTKVYEVMQGTDAEILSFMQGNSTDFFQKSFLAQEDLLTEWSKKIGIFNEEKVYDFYEQQGQKTLPQVWETEEGSALKKYYDKASQEQKDTWIREYNDQYADAIMEGKSETEAVALAQKELIEHIEAYKKALEEAAKKTTSQATNSGGSSGGNSGGSSGSSSSKTSKSGSSSSKTNKSISDPGTIEVVTASGKTSSGAGYKDAAAAKKIQGEEIVEIRYKNKAGQVTHTLTAFASGGLIDYTGPAWVDGSKSKPERILSAEQNKILEEGLAMNAGRSDRLQEIFSNFAENLGASVRASISNITNRTSSSAITIQPGAVQLNIEQLNDKYDVDELFNDVADRLYSIASKASGRGVSRR